MARSPFPPGSPRDRVARQPRHGRRWRAGVRDRRPRSSDAGQFGHPADLLPACHDRWSLRRPGSSAHIPDHGHPRQEDVTGGGAVTTSVLIPPRRPVPGGTMSQIRAASVVLPLLPRPSMASTAGQPGLLRSGPGLVAALTSVLKGCTRHGPASGSSRASCKAMSPSCRSARPGTRCYQIRGLVSNPDDTDAELLGPRFTAETTPSMDYPACVTGPAGMWRRRPGSNGSRRSSR